MSRCFCGCHDVEASVEKLQSLLAIESHLDDEMDELERRHQLDQLKYEWLVREGCPDLCDVIKQQMQKTESLLLMYTPMLQDTCAEKEAHITHILAMQRRRQHTAHWGQIPQHQQLQQEAVQVQEHTRGMFPGWQFGPDHDCLQYPCSMLNGHQVQSQHSQYLSSNATAFMGNTETMRSDIDKSSGHAVGKQKADGNAFPYLQKEYRAIKRKRNRNNKNNIFQKPRGRRSSRSLRCESFSSQKHPNPSNVFPRYLKIKTNWTKASCVLGQSHHRHSFLKALRRKMYDFHAKKIKLSARNKTSEGSSSHGQLLRKSTNITQPMEVQLSDKKRLHVTQINRSKSTFKRRARCNHLKRTITLGLNSKSLQGNVPSSILMTQPKQTTSQDRPWFLFRMSSHNRHKSQQNSEFKKLLQSHERKALNNDEAENTNLERRGSFPSRNDTGAESFRRSISFMENITVNEGDSVNINDYLLPNSPEGFDFSGTHCARE